MIIPLLELGLNKYEATVYLTLVSEGISTAKNISDITSIPYGKVYEVISTLEGKGFIKTLPSKPMKCQAIHPKDVVNITRNKFQEKYHKLESQIVNELAPLFEESRKFNEPKSVFWAINGRANVNNKIEEMIKKAQQNICFFISENGLKRLVIHKEQLEDAKSRGVKISIIGPVTKENIEDIKSLDFCELRHIKEAPSHLISVDGKECLMVEPVPDDDNILYGRDLGVWITSNPFTQLLEHSFETNFKKGRKVDPVVMYAKVNGSKK